MNDSAPTPLEPEDVAEPSSYRRTPVLIWDEGLVTIGVDSLMDYLAAATYGTADEHPNIYLTRRSASDAPGEQSELAKVKIKQTNREVRADDWIDETYGVDFIDTGQRATYFTLRIDGRA